MSDPPCTDRILRARSHPYDEVGAPDEDSNATGIGGDQANNDDGALYSGAVYVYRCPRRHFSAKSWSVESTSGTVIIELVGPTCVAVQEVGVSSISLRYGCPTVVKAPR